MARQKHTSSEWSELALIEAIKNQPILYDKALKDYRKSAPTELAWVAIAKEVNADADDCKKRWKSLRDTYIKYYRMELVNKTPLNSRKRTWKYYKECDFLRPFVELFRLDDSPAVAAAPTKKETTTPVKQVISTIPANTSVTRTGMVRCEYTNKSAAQSHQTYNVVLPNDDDDETEYQIFEANEAGELQEIRAGTDDGYLEEYDEHEQEGEEYQETDELTESNRANSKTIDIIDLPVKKPVADDPDEKFLMSCLPVLKRLSNKKNALLKLKIQTLLFEVEFGDADDDQPLIKRRRF